MSDSTLCYEVPGVELIVQDKTMACWYASAMMVINPGVYGASSRDTSDSIEAVFLHA
jgi:hypothetical protein